MKTVLLILANTLRVTFRRRSALVVYLLLPVGGVLLALAIMSSAATRPVRVGIVDNDGGIYAADLVTNIEGWGNYVTLPAKESEIDSLITANKLDCGLVIPAGYSAGLPAGRIEKVALVSLKGRAVTAALESLVDQYSAGLSDLARAAAGDPAKFAALYADVQRTGITLNEAQLPDQRRDKGITLISMGYFLLFLMLGAGITSQLILSEKQSRTYQRICSAPVKPRHYLAGNGAAALIIIVAQIVVVLAVMRGILGVQTYVPDFLLGVILFLFGIVAVALGMLIAAFAPSFGVAAGLSTLIITPSCMLSGCFWSISGMPPFLQKVALFMPQRWVLAGITRLQEGGSAGAVGIDLLVLVAFAVAFFLVAVYGFSRREESGQFV